MGILKQVRPGRLVPLGIILLVAVLVLVWGHGGARQVAADTPHAGLDFSMEVPGAAGCNTTSGDAECFVPPGGTFTVNFLLNDRGGIGYRAFQVHALYSGVTSKENEDAEVWPDCVYEAIPSPRVPGDILIACAFGLGIVPEEELSTYTGVMATVDFNCTESESSGNTITLVHGTFTDTLLTDGSDMEHAEAEAGVADETLTINCQIAPTPTAPPAPTSTPPAPTATIAAEELPPTGAGPSGNIDGNGGVSAGLWTVIGALLVASAAGIGVIGWRRYARSR